MSLWYFAYGSNLDPGTFLGRRRMRPLDTRVARLDDWALVFDLPVGRGERGVGNVRPAPGACIWGVAYELTGRDCARLDGSEGVHRGAYRRVPISLCVPDDEMIEAFTYRSGRGRPGRRPSRRYLGLLIKGARHHGLPGDYVWKLRAIDVARDERQQQQELFSC